VDPFHEIVCAHWLLCFLFLHIRQLDNPTYVLLLAYLGQNCNIIFVVHVVTFLSFNLFRFNSELINMLAVFILNLVLCCCLNLFIKWRADVTESVMSVRRYVLKALLVNIVAQNVEVEHLVHLRML
jgi:hypothetical protein